MDLLRVYACFEVNNFTGDALSAEIMGQNHCEKIEALQVCKNVMYNNVAQRVAFKNFPELKELALANIAAVDTRESLVKHFQRLDEARLRQLAFYLDLLPEVHIY